MDATATAKLGAAFVVIAAAFDFAALYVPGVALLALAAGARAWVGLGAGDAAVEREPGAPTVVEGEPYPVRHRMRRGALPVRGQVHDPVLSEPLSLRTGLRRGERLLRSEARFARRGRRRLEPPRLLISDPLGLCSRELEAGGRVSELLVLPRTEPVLAAPGGAAPGGDAEEGPSRGSRGGLMPEVEVDGIRPYREGSPASRIHWPVYARHGELVERRIVGGAQGTPLVIVDAVRPVSEEALDAAVRAAASLCLHLARRGGCVLLAGRHARALEVDRELRAWPRALARLALLAPGETPPAPAAAASAAVFWVTAAVGGAWPPVRGAAESFLVTPFPPAAARPAFTVAGCAGIALGGHAHRLGARAA